MQAVTSPISLPFSPLHSRVLFFPYIIPAPSSPKPHSISPDTHHHQSTTSTVLSSCSFIYSLSTTTTTTTKMLVLLPVLFSFLLGCTAAAAAATPPEQTLEIKPEYINPKLPPRTLSTSKKFEGSSNLVNLKYHMGPVLSSSPIKVYIIWYGHWQPQQQLLIKDFLHSISPTTATKSTSPTVASWWKTVSLYTDQTNSNISSHVIIANEHSDHKYSQGKNLNRLTIQQVISNAVKSKSLPIDHKNGMYLILTSPDVTMQDFCRAVCGFHYFTFPSQVGYTIPYAWVGNSEKQCPEVCAYPFAIPTYMSGSGLNPLKPPNNDIGIDGMISVIGHELAELSSNPLINAWYAGEDPVAPTEIGDLCEGLYGSGGGGGFIGEVMRGKEGASFNLFGGNGRRFLVQWIWNNDLKACAGPNAMD